MLDRFVELLTAELGTDHGVWLYGSRARGETPGEESDVDVLVVSAATTSTHGGGSTGLPTRLRLLPGRTQFCSRSRCTPLTASTWHAICRNRGKARDYDALRISADRAQALIADAEAFVDAVGALIDG
jgi:Nucleotidyltransferase domain